MNEKKLNIRTRLTVFLVLTMLLAGFMGLNEMEPREAPTRNTHAHGAYEVSVDGIIVIYVPAQTFFNSKVVFRDLRSGDELRKVKIKIGVDDDVNDWKQKAYSGKYDWEGTPKGERKYSQDYGAEEGPDIAVIFELYRKVGDVWIQQSWTHKGSLITLREPLEGREPVSLTLTDERFFISVDTVLVL